MSPAVLMVSKPVAPPWNDSSKNLVRDLAQSGQRYRYHLLTPAGAPLPGSRVVSEPLYRGGGRFSPALAQNLRVVARLLRPDRTALTHFFFAPNPRTSRVARLALTLRPRLAVQTVCSTPASFHRAADLLFAQKVVVLSRHTRGRLEQAGVDPARLVHIPPGIRPPAAPGAEVRRRVRAELGIPDDAPLLLFAGDYQFSGAVRTVALATARITTPNTHLVLACRIKQPESVAIEGQIRDLLGELGTLSRVRMLREVPEMIGLLSACDLCLMPAESLYAKMDLPLVLLEAMALGLPLVVSDTAPLCELLDDPVGEGVPPGDPEALAAAVDRLLQQREARLTLGENARRAVARRYHIEQVSAQHEDLYDRLLGRRPSASRSAP